MKTYLSIIKIVPNFLAGDAISVGMILSNDKDYFIRFSNRKIRVAKSLVSDNKSFIDFFLTKIERKINEINDVNSRSNGLFEYPNRINSDYMRYLDNYNNNIIQFDPPKYVKEETNLDTFNKLFSLYVNKETELNILQKFNDLSQQSKLNVERKLIERVKDKVHTNIKFTDKILPTLYFNIDVDCIGLNGVFTGAKTVDFNQSEHTIQKEISNYYALTSMLENNHDKYGKANNFYIISDEPSVISSKQHKYWEKMKNAKKFNVIFSEESDMVAKKIEETNAGLFLSV